MARNGRTGQVTALVQQIPKKQEWQRTSKTADKASSTLGKNQALFDAITDVVKSALSDLYNVPKNDPRLIAIIRTIVDYVNGSIKQQLDENTTIEKIVENTENIVDSDKLKSIVEKALKKTAKESITSKEQYEKLSKSISKVVISNLFESKEYEKHKALLEDIKSQLNAASESLSKIIDNKTATEQKPSTQDKADKSKTDFNKQLASLTKMIQKINGICQSIASKQKDLSKSLSKSVKMLDAAQSISNKIKDQVKQSAKMQSDVKNITTSGFNQTAKQIKDVNEAVEEVNENVKSISSSGSILGILGGGFGIALKALTQLGKVFILGPIKFIGKYILGPIVSFVGSVVKGLGKIILAPIKLIGKGISKVIDGITNVAAKSFGAFIMSPAGMYTIGYIAGFVWTMWLKDWWEKIKTFFESDTWKIIKTTVANILSWCEDFFESDAWKTISSAILTFCSWFTKENWEILKRTAIDTYNKLVEFYNAYNAFMNKDKFVEDTVNEYNKAREQDIQAEKDKNAKLTEEDLKEKQRSNFLDDNTLRDLMRQAQMVNKLQSKNELNKEFKNGSWFDRFALGASDWWEDVTDGLNSRDLEIEYKQRLTDLKVKLAKLGITDPEKFISENLSTLITLDSIKDDYIDGDFAISDADLNLTKLTLARQLGLEKEDILTEESEYDDNPSFGYAAYMADKEEHELEEKLIQYEQEDVLREYKRRQQEIEDAISKQTPKITVENNVIETNEQQKDDSYFIGSGWQSIDKKWIYGYDGENNSEYARAIKEGTPIVQANTTLSKDQLQQLFARQQGIKVEDVAFNDLQSALAESGLSIGGAADVGSSKQLAKNIATYLADTQKQIDAMPAEEQRAWQTKLNETIHRLIEAIDKRQPQQNLMYLQVGQPSLNPANYDK